MTPRAQVFPRAKKPEEADDGEVDGGGVGSAGVGVSGVEDVREVPEDGEVGGVLPSCGRVLVSHC